MSKAALWPTSTVSRAKARKAGNTCSIVGWPRTLCWVMPWIEPQLNGLRLQQIDGSVWDGDAGEVIGVDGRRLGRLHWQLSRRALLGDVRMRVAFDGPRLGFSGAMRRLSDSRVAVDDFRLHADLAVLDGYPPSPWGRPRGELRLTVEHALLQGGWPVQLQAHGLWRHAAVHAAGNDVALGDMQITAQAQGGVVEARWHDAGGGPLHVTGELQLSPLGWRLDSTLRARQTDRALQRWLARLGPASADGSVHIRQSGGLAAPATSTERGDRSP